jgi:hypothetical protein
MFHFTGLLRTYLCIQYAAVGYPGITACLPAPPGLSQTSTPFILLTPRHPPYALDRLAIEIPNSAHVIARSSEEHLATSIYRIGFPNRIYNNDILNLPLS